MLASYLYGSYPVCYEHKDDCVEPDSLADPPILMPPYVGMPCTICYMNDRHAATVIYISKGGHKVIVRECTATRTDDNGMSSDQTYIYTANDLGREHTFHRRDDGDFAQRGKFLLLGTRDHYFCYEI